MAEKIFHIENVTLQYSTGNPVLEIDRLEIDTGLIYFIIGPSGAGKSTLIESLGLMTNTIDSNNSKEFSYYQDENDKIDFKNIWSKNDATLSELRKSNFSFLFQNNFLMANFSTYENMIFTMDHQINSANVHRESELHILMESLGLDLSLKNRNISKLSGGQKQRVAFVRSLLAPFKILFADEPTGNLDSVSSKKLFNVLKNEIKKSNRTVVAVSHDLSLAQEFGDIIVPILMRKCSNGFCGYIHSNNNLIKMNDSWFNSTGQKIQNIKLMGT
jgi:putative ABC transport system ATP-binding protein